MLSLPEWDRGDERDEMMNQTDADTLESLVDAGLLSEDSVSRIRAVKAAERSFSAESKLVATIVVLVLLCAAFAGVYATEWLPAGVRAFSYIMSTASGLGVMCGLMVGAVRQA